MTNFPAGQLLIREFESMTDAHRTAGELSETASKAKLDLRLIEISATAGGAWICAWLPKESKHDADALSHAMKLQLVEVDEKLMNAFLSLGPKISANCKRVLILEGKSIADVFRSAKVYENAGATLLEIRVKRSGAMGGAFAYLAAEEKEIQVASPITATSIPLVGDYRRFFL